MALVFLIFEPPKEIDRGGTCAGYGLRCGRLSERRGADQGGSGLGRLLKIRGEGKEDSREGQAWCVRYIFTFAAMAGE